MATVASQKTHGASGTFSVNLPLTSNPGIESRSSATSGDQQIVITFVSPVTVGGVTVASQDNRATADPPVVNGQVVTINLHNVTNAQRIAVTLLNVNDGTTTTNVVIPMGVLLGDTNGNRSVNAGDIGQTKAQSGAPVTSANFRTDVNTDGFINATDVGLVKAHSGTSIP